MMRIGVLTAAAMLAAPAFGQTALAPVLERLEDQGYGDFEVETGRGRLKVEAVKDGVERELVYDAASGRLLSDVQRPTDDRGGAVATERFARLYETLSASGHTGIKIEQEGRRIEVDAVKNGRERDLTYDAATGRLISARVDDGDDDGDDDRGRDGDDDDRGARGTSGQDGSGSGARGGDHDDDDDDDDGDDHGGRGASGQGDSGSRGRGGDRDDDDGDDRGGHDD